ncbi:MAG: hypothetical protein IKR79_05520 [Bacteroidales bacterium]|nr:hypothetical protein [Bacteroidales bacterium]MBR6331088.1 hypothetical protein [Bacteroidales bacterium]
MNIRIKTNFQFLVSSIQYAPNGELCITLMSDTATEEKHFEYTANLGSGQAEERPPWRICDPTLVNIRIFNPQHNKTLATALMLAD